MAKFDGHKVLQGAAESATYNVLLQLFFRLQTFAVNSYVIRQLSQDVLGLINVRLYLLYYSISILSKDPIRTALLSNLDPRKWHQIINFFWIWVPVSGFVGILLGYIWLYWLEAPEGEMGTHYTTAVLVACVCPLIEQIGEIPFFVMKVYMFNKAKVFIDSVSVSVRIISLAMVIYIGKELWLQAFCLGYLASSLVYVFLNFFVMWYYIKYMQPKRSSFLPKTSGSSKPLISSESSVPSKREDDEIVPRKRTGTAESFLSDRSSISVELLNSPDEFPFVSMRDFFPKYVPNEDLIPWDQVYLTRSFFKQTVLKLVLSEGERYVMTMSGLLNFAEQGVFDLVNNLGSLAARLLFRPIEEAGYLFFAQTIDRDIPVQEQAQVDVKLYSGVLCNILKSLILLSLVIMTFAQGYSYLLLLIYGGPTIATGIGTYLMKCHSVYVMFLAVNGITECFMVSAMTYHQVEKYNIILIVYSVVSLLLTYYLALHFGCPGFIYANCINMLMRIITNTTFIYRYFNVTTHRPLQGLLPDKVVLFALFGALVTTMFSGRELSSTSTIGQWIMHVLIGAASFVIVKVVIYIREKELVRFLLTIWKDKQVKTD